MPTFKDVNGNLKTGLLGSLSVVAIIFVIFVGVFISEFGSFVNPSYKGLVIKGGELQDEVLDNGFYFKMPFWTDIVSVFTGVQSTDDEVANANSDVKTGFRGIEPLSKDGQVMLMDVQINYAISDPVKFRVSTGSSDPKTIENLLFVPMVRRFVYDYTSEYTWKNLIQGGDRQELGQRVYETLSTGEATKRVCKDEHTEIDANTKAEIIVEAGCLLEDLEKVAQPGDFGVIVTAVNFRRISPNQNIIAAVEEAQKKEQEVKIAEQEAEIAKQMASKAIEEKRGVTESRKLEQEAEAYKMQVELEAKGEGMKAEAEGKIALANAERQLASALASSSGLIEYKMIEVKLIEAEAKLELAKHYKGEVSDTVTIIGTEEAKDMRLIYGLQNTMVGVDAQ